MGEFIKAMISSTFRDLKEHRREAILACLQAEVFPLIMEAIPASTMTPIEASLDMVNKADIYIGIFGYRYGTIPKGDDLSIMHQEYFCACGRGIPRLIFIIDEDYPITISMVEVGDRSETLNELKTSIEQDIVIQRFRSPDDLRGKINSSLVNYLLSSKKPYIYMLPYPTERYEHDELLGRKESLTSLTNWVTNTSSQEYKYNNNIYVIDAISGMGKSLLAWKWFNSMTPNLWKRKTWWSLYQREEFDILLKLTLVNLIGRGEQEISRLNTDNKMNILLETLEQEPLLLVLDGLEHALVNGESRSIALDRRTVDTPIEIFLDKFRRLDRPKSRILITTTIYPKILSKFNGQPRQRVYQHKLNSLSDIEALELWEGVGLPVLQEEAKNNLLSLMNRFGNHPFFIRALAGEVKQNQQSSGNFQIWWTSNKDNPLGRLHDISAWMSNLLNNVLGTASRKVLLTISAFYCPCRYNVLSTLMSQRGMPEGELSCALTDLEARGLINPVADDGDVFYRIHQLIIDASWGKLGIEEQVTLAKQLFDILVKNRYYNDAYDIFIGRLNRITFELKYNSLRAELLEKLFLNGIQNHPKLTDNNSSIEHDKKAIAIACLVRAKLISGELRSALLLSKNHVAVRTRVSDMIHVAKARYYLSYELFLLGKLHEAEECIKESLRIFIDENNVFLQVLCLQMLKGLWVTINKHEELSKISIEISAKLKLIQSTNSSNDNQQISEVTNIKYPRELLDSIAADVNCVQKELEALNEKALRFLSEERYDEALQHLDKVFLHKDYRLIQADAFLIKAKVEKARGNREAAMLAAKNAYEKAWCDAPPHAYHRVLEEAKNLLNGYNEPYPEPIID